MYQEVAFNDTISDKHKNKIVMEFSEVDKRLVDGADEHLSMINLAVGISEILAGR